MPSTHVLLRPQRRAWRWILLALAVYVLCSLYLLFSLALPSSQDGLAALQQGEGELAGNPARAAVDFSQASRLFGQSVTNLQQAPLAAKLLAPLPPFRWQVRLLKADRSLSLAGDVAASLAASFPTTSFPPSADLSTSLQTASTAYLPWYSSHRSELGQLQDQLGQATEQLQGVPAWVMLGQRQQVEQLQYQVSQAGSTLASLRQLSDALARAFGANDQTSHAFLVAEQDPSRLSPIGGPLTAYGVLRTGQGSVRALELSPASFPSNPTTQGFLADAAPTLAGLYRESAIEGMLILNRSLLEQLRSLDATLPPANDLAHFLPALVSRLSQRPELLGPAASILRQGIAAKSLQAWSSQPALQRYLEQSLPADRPNSGDWLKVAVSTPGQLQLTPALSLHLEREEQPLAHRLQHTLALDLGQGDVQVYLPAQATVNALPDPAAHLSHGPNWQRLDWSQPGPVRHYLLSYSLPLTPENQSGFTYLSQAGASFVHFQGLGYDGLADQNLFLRP